MSSLETPLLLSALMTAVIAEAARSRATCAVLACTFTPALMLARPGKHQRGRECAGEHGTGCPRPRGLGDDGGHQCAQEQRRLQRRHPDGLCLDCAAVRL